MTRLQKVVPVIYMLGLLAICAFLVPWEQGIAFNSGRIVPQSRIYSSLFDPPSAGGRLAVSLDLALFSAEVAIWTLLNGAGFLLLTHARE